MFLIKSCCLLYFNHILHTAIWHLHVRRLVSIQSSVCIVWLHLSLIGWIISRILAFFCTIIFLLYFWVSLYCQTVTELGIMQVTASRLFKNKRFGNQGLWLIDISSLDNINLNVINFASEVTFRLNYYKSLIVNRKLLSVFSLF